MLTPLRHPWTALNYLSAYNAYLLHRVEKVTLCRGSVSPSLSTGRALQMRGQRCSRARGEGFVSAGFSSCTLRQLPDYQRQTRFEGVNCFNRLAINAD